MERTRPTHSNLERQTLAIFWRVLMQNKGLFYGSLIYFGGVICVTILVPFFISSTFATLVLHPEAVGASLVPLTVVAAIGVLCNLIGFACTIRLSARGQRDTLELALTTLLKRSVGFHTNNIGGKLVNNALDYPSAWGRLIDATYINFIPFILIMTVGIGIVLSRSLAIGSALAVLTLVTVALIILEGRRRSNLRAKRKVAQNKMIANLSDTIVNTQAVKTFAGEARELASHRKLDGTLLQLRLKDWTGIGINGGIRLGVLLGMQIGFISFIAWLIQRDPSMLTIGIFSFAYTLSLTSRLFEASGTIRNIEEAFLQASSMTEILLQDTEIVDAAGARPLRVTQGALSLQNVSFHYSDTSKDDSVFQQLSLEVPAGQKVGLVGPSGGGKSTLTRLLLRFDDVTGGSITIDGQDIKKVTQASLREAIAYVPQEPLLFHRSIFENIAYGKPRASLIEVKQAAKLAFAAEFIEKLPSGYNTIVGERGVKLSGGQRQRVAIARAILKDAPILVLDEATSALDSESELYIQKALTELMKGRTTIVVAHRLSTIQKMDRIIVLSDGVIVEDGSHRQLVKKHGLYAKLWSHQSGGFIEE